MVAWVSHYSGGGLGTDADIVAARSSDDGASWTAPVSVKSSAAYAIVWVFCRCTIAPSPPLPTLSHLLIWLVVPCVQPKSCRTDGTIADRAPTVAALSGEDGTWLAVWETVCCGSDFDLVAAVSTTDGASWGSFGALFDNAGMVSDAMRCGDV